MYPAHMVGLILATAIGGSAGFLAQRSGNKVPSRRVRALGMSGIVTGIGLALAVFDPRATVGVYGISIPNFIAVRGYLAWDIILLPSENSNIGHVAHIGGGIAGLLYAVALRTSGSFIIPPQTYSTHPLKLQSQIDNLVGDVKGNMKRLGIDHPDNR